MSLPTGPLRQISLPAGPFHLKFQAQSDEARQRVWATASSIAPGSAFRSSRLTAAIAGIQQGANAFSGYGQGAKGYAKRYGASYADSAIGTFIGGAILPSVFKQDPRYFYKGTGTRRSRFFYAIANAVICKGDNGHWQANYSSMLGSLAAGGISNLYYPDSDRDATVTFENTLIAIGSNAANNLLQEFVIRKLTRNAPTYAPTPSASRP